MKVGESWEGLPWGGRELEVKLLYQETKAMVWEHTRQLVCPFQAQIQILSERDSHCLTQSMSYATAVASVGYGHSVLQATGVFSTTLGTQEK